MSSQNALFETPTRTATTRFREKEHTEDAGLSHLGAQTNTRSPSQRLKDLFFATYTSGIDPQSSHKSSRSGSYARAALQTPTKSGSSSNNNSNSRAAGSGGIDRDAMDVDVEMEEDDPSGPEVGLAINTTGRFYSEHMRRCELRIELLWLQTPGRTPRGVYVMPSLESTNVWHGVMFVKRGYWRDAVVRFRIDIPREYPRTHPVITLATPVAHPLVRLEDGRFALEQQFPQWTPYSDYIFHALNYLKNSFKNRVLKQLQSRDCFNVAAYLRFKNDLPQFRELARIDSMKSRMPENLFRQQPHDCPIVFSPLSNDDYEAAIQRIKLIASSAQQQSTTGSS
ncbi:hypothetical protein LPJ59_000727 [Coemansia sp. RSA 2399]|nr:hypothetical protein LPJ59_000727 [Coemansia sp. RSA 2399]KAJ1907707.1 hypothetical protein LPJ81_000590 [Coemansia sp. IMI 209127]